MNAEVKKLSLPHPKQEQHQKPKWMEHIELICALLSGVFILIGYVLQRQDAMTVAVPFYLLAFVIGGYAKAKEGITKTIKEKKLNVEILMILAAIGSTIIGYWTEGAILIFIFSLSGAMETYTMNKSNKEISALLDLQPETATLLVNGQERVVSIKELEVGDTILVKPGERIPTDGTIIKGSTTLDEAAITGESVPVLKTNDDDVFAGTMNIRGAITVRITKPTDQTLFQKIIKLVQEAQSEKSPSQLFIEKFEGTYVKSILFFVALMMFIPHYVFDWSWNETFYRAMILLVVGSPCALVASITPATLSAISNGARHGILFKGGVHLEQLAKLKAVAFDKTGTLTKGKPEVTDMLVREGYSIEEVLLLTASIESRSTHPLAEAIVRYAKETYHLTLEEPHALEDIAGSGVKATLYDKEYKIGKMEFVGKEQAQQFQNGAALAFENEGKTTIYIGDDEGILGVVALKDTLRPESIEAIGRLNDAGIQTIMITGDSPQTAKAIAAECGLSTYYARCLPAEKVERVKQLKEEYQTVGMTGDGINDAPALATASVGIAMGEGTDVALETADIVLMKNDLTKLADAIQLSNRMNKIVKQNIIFSISVIAVLILSNFFQFIDLPFGVIGHEGSTILVILNGLRLLK
ncbi:MAG: heavy metal translocating P-type ATPase [Bacillaceae bacterium]